MPGLPFYWFLIWPHNNSRRLISQRERIRRSTIKSRPKVSNNTTSQEQSNLQKKNSKNVVVMSAVYFEQKESVDLSNSLLSGAFGTGKEPINQDG